MYFAGSLRRTWLHCLIGTTLGATVGKSWPGDLHSLVKREQCGDGVGSCSTAGECCSQYGWCGSTSDHCGKNCQPTYGPCSEGPGTDTLDTPRPRFGAIPYGVEILNCNIPGNIAITFDDGPYVYTSQLLDLLASSNVKATFFINGNNFADITEAPYPDILRRMYRDGHQIASHTYTHQDLSKLDTAGRRKQMAQVESLLKDLFGWFPTYMRPPFGSCDSACQADMGDLGYHVITWNIDTLDYDHDSEEGIQTSMNIFDSVVSENFSGNAYISLAHDVHQYTVEALAAHIIETTLSRGYQAVTVGECLGDAYGNWYRNATTGEALGGGSDTVPTASPDGTCGSGSDNRYTCLGASFGNCCSTQGLCGSTDSSCGTGCQQLFGSCGGDNQNYTKSPDGTCGSSSIGNYTCKETRFGQCCSQYGYCGSLGNADFCGSGCQSKYGTCS